MWKNQAAGQRRSRVHGANAERQTTLIDESQGQWDQHDVEETARRKAAVDASHGQDFDEFTTGKKRHNKVRKR